MSQAPTITARFTAAGVPTRLDADDLSLLQYPGSALEAGPHQVWLRRRGADGTSAVLGLLGPASGGTVAVGDGAVVAEGTEADVGWCLWFDQPADGLFGWSLRLTNVGTDTVELDAVCTLDVALTPREALRRNEFYVSQYLDLTPLEADGSTILAVRQNMPGPTTPWLALTCTRPVAGWCTDALQLAGRMTGTGLDLTVDLPSTRLQHEHTLAGLQSEPIVIAPGESATVGFRALVLRDHPAASSVDDVAMVSLRMAAAPWSEAPPAVGAGAPVVPTLFGSPTWLHGEELEPAEFLGITGHPVTQVEEDGDGSVWACTAGGEHVVAAAKERAVLRPHGHILVAPDGPRPSDVVSAVTVWMTGTVASQLTRGHADAEPMLSVRRSYLGLTLAEGVRLFADDGHGWRLLGVPSAWGVTADTARWWWRWGGNTITARTRITAREMIVDVAVMGTPMQLMLAARTGRAEDTGDAHLHADGLAREPGWITTCSQVGSVQLRVPLGTDGSPVDGSLLAATPRLGGPASVDALAGFLPWLAQDALIHYQVPRGLEQFTGGAWGTRDVCQGPVGLLVAAGRPDLVRAVLLVVFGAQQDDGDWPQWFEYLSQRRGAGHRESHGDVVYWPLLALGEYLAATGDIAILDEEVGWVGEQALLDASPIRAHVRAAVEHLAGQRAHDPQLPAYGHGDWNDSLQPADPELARWMTSAWTAELEIKTLSTLAASLRDVEPDFAARLENMADATGDAMREHLLVEGELAGYAILAPSGVEVMVHPRDSRTGLAHGSLQMIHAIGDELLSPEEARSHVKVIDEHLDGPTGILLFDRPVAYHGGELHMFVRAEAASFWGREIGLMYTHAHLRWVEALLRLGDADRAWDALQLVIPTGLGAAVPGAGARQSNCYYSSIDARFVDRWDAESRAGRMFDPDFGFEGGWRVYSSGPGLILRLVVEGMLGLRCQADGVVVDPVLPTALDGLLATVVLDGRVVHVRYSVSGAGHGVSSLLVNGQAVETRPAPRRYRKGGVLIPGSVWRAAAGEGDIQLSVGVG